MKNDSSPLHLRPSLDDLDRLMEFVESFAETHGLTLLETNTFAVSAEELFANTVHHSRATRVEFSLEAGDGFVTATYIDDGPEFDPTRYAAADTTLGAEERRIGGLGVHFIRRTMSLFAYQRSVASGRGRNVVTFGRAVQGKSG